MLFLQNFYIFLSFLCKEGLRDLQLVARAMGRTGFWKKLYKIGDLVVVGIEGRFVI